MSEYCKRKLKTFLVDSRFRRWLLTDNEHSQRTHAIFMRDLRHLIPQVHKNMAKVTRRFFSRPRAIKTAGSRDYIADDVTGHSR